jgi:hypothetical protein
VLKASDAVGTPPDEPPNWSGRMFAGNAELEPGKDRLRPSADGADAEADFVNANSDAVEP